MAVSKAEIVNFLQANPNMSDADIASAMAQYGVTPAQMAAATGLSEGQVISRVAATVPQGSSITLGDTRIVPSYQVIGSGEDQQIGALENIFVDKTTGDLNYKAPVGSTYQQLSADGTFERTGVTQKDQSFLGGLAGVLNDPIIQAALLASGVGGAIGGSLGLTGSTAQAVGTGLFKAGSAAVGGADIGDALKAGLLSGGLVYGGAALNNAIKYQDVPVDFNTMTTDQINDALDINFRNDLARAGLTNSEIKGYLANPASIYDASAEVTPTDLATTPSITNDTVNVSATTTPTLNNLLNTVANPTVTVTSQKTPEQVDQSVLDLINSQLATNVTTPTTLANVEVTGNKAVSSGDTTEIGRLLGLLPTLNTVAPVTTNLTPIVNVVGQKPIETTVIDKPIIEPVVKPVVKPIIGNNEVVITGERPINITDLLASLVQPIAITPTVNVVGQKPIETTVIDKPIIEPVVKPIVKSTIAEQVITGDRPLNITDLVASLVQPITSTPTVNVVDQRPKEPIIIDKPIIEPKPPVEEVVIKDNKPTITIEDILSVLTNTLPTPPTTLPEVVIKDQKPVPPLLPPIIVEPPQKPIIEPLRPVEPTIIDKPIIEPNTPVKPTIAEQVITGDRTINLNNLLSTLVAPVTLTPTVKVVDKKPVEPTIVDKPIIEPKPPVEPDPLKVIQDTAKIVNLLNTDTGTNQTVTTTDTGFPIVPIPADWTNPSATGVAPFTPLSPIDFGTRELLRGTQWEKFLSPTYGQVPEPVKFLQPSNMSYNDLMTILNGNQTPSRSNLSINDIISGIQNQYGQTPTSTMG